VNVLAQSVIEHHERTNQLMLNNKREMLETIRNVSMDLEKRMNGHVETVNTDVESVAMSTIE
jgi:hypothetical protein